MINPGYSVLAGIAGHITDEDIRSHFELYGTNASRSESRKISHGCPDNCYDYGTSTFPLLMDRKMASKTASIFISNVGIDLGCLWAPKWLPK